MNLILNPARRMSMEDNEAPLLESLESEEQDHSESLRPYEILTYPADFTLEVLVDKWHKKEITVPEIQRGFVWSQARASKLIESFLLGLPVPPVFFYQDRVDSHLLVVDGQQRLLSIAYFFSGVFGDTEREKKVASFNLINLGKSNPFNNLTYTQLEKNDPASYNRLKNSVLRSYVMKQLDPQDDDTSIFEVFERLNTGGVALEGQEIRNCIYYGNFNNLLRELNKTPTWRKIIGRDAEDKRMRDVELVLRFLALFYNLKKYEKPMKNFLNVFVKANRNVSPERAQQFTNLFTRTANVVIDYLGERPFHIRKGLNAAVFDSVFTAFARNLDPDSEKPLGNLTKESLRINFKKLIGDTDYSYLISSATTNTDVVPRRIEIAERILFR